MKKYDIIILGTTFTNLAGDQCYYIVSAYQQRGVSNEPMQLEMNTLGNVAPLYIGFIAAVSHAYQLFGNRGCTAS